MNILICGLGNVGKMVVNSLIGLRTADNIHKFHTYDKKIPSEFSDKIAENQYDYAFICVPTNMNEDGSCDISEVEDVLSKVNSDIFIIKSTIPVGTTEYLKNKYNKNIIFSPEFCGTTIHSPVNPSFLILGGDKNICDKVADLYHKVTPADFKITFTDSKTAELVKYMENSFLALKVTFCAEFYHIAKQYGISYNELRELIVLDERIGKSHTYINPEQPFYDSHCLNKDIPAIIDFCTKNNIDVPLLKSINSINKESKKYYKRDDEHEC